MALTGKGRDFVLFKRTKDESHIAHWMSWQTNRIEWKKASNGHWIIKSTIRFRRELDPYWYFAPLQRYAVGLAGDYILDMYLG